MDLSLLRDRILTSHITVREVNRFSAAASQNLLDRLLDCGHITPAEYLKRLPAGTVTDREELIALLERKEAEA